MNALQLSGTESSSENMEKKALGEERTITANSWNGFRCLLAGTLWIGNAYKTKSCCLSKLLLMSHVAFGCFSLR